MSQNSASERLPVAELKPLPRPVRILFPVVSSCTLWYLLFQGGALGYAQLQTIVEPAAAALPQEAVEERPARRATALLRPVRPEPEALALT